MNFIKLPINLFDDPKIIYLQHLPEGKIIVLCWIMLLTLAGQCQHEGCVYLTENIPYTPLMLSQEMKINVTVIQSALKAFQELDMIHLTDSGWIFINDWARYQPK